MAKNTDKPTTLYRFFDESDQLLYVGISHRIQTRLTEHKVDKPWESVARIEIEWFPTRKAARQAEVQAIQAEHPAWNIADSRTRATSQPATPQIPGSLVGKCFHIPKQQDDGCRTIAYQGEIMAEVTEDVFMIRYFDWLHGTPVGSQEMVFLEDMVGWLFYDGAEEMRYAYQYRIGLQSEMHYRHIESIV